MSERSAEVESAIKESMFVTADLSKAEKKIFNKIKRNLMRTFVNPNHSVKIMIDLTAMEYIRYFRQPKDGEIRTSTSQRTKVVSIIKDCLSELDLTPKSKKAGEVSTTLSQIFKSIGEQHGNGKKGGKEMGIQGEDGFSGDGDSTLH